MGEGSEASTACGSCPDGIPVIVTPGRRVRSSISYSKITPFNAVFHCDDQLPDARGFSVRATGTEPASSPIEMRRLTFEKSPAGSSARVFTMLKEKPPAMDSILSDWIPVRNFSAEVIDQPALPDIEAIDCFLVEDSAGGCRKSEDHAFGSWVDAVARRGHLSDSMRLNHLVVPSGAKMEARRYHRKREIGASYGAMHLLPERCAAAVTPASPGELGD